MTNVKKWLFFSKKSKTVLLIALAIAGFFIRVYALGVRSLWLDESISAVYAEGFLQHGWPVWDGTTYISGILHTGFTSISFALFGVSEWAGRLPSVLFGVSTIPLAYLLGKRVKNSRVGLILAFLVTFSTVEILWSRQLRFYQQLQFFFILSLYLSDKIMDETNWKTFSLLLISVLCMTQSHGTLGYLLAMPVAGWFVLGRGKWIAEKAIRFRELSKKDWIGVGLLVIFALSILYFGKSLILNELGEGYERLLRAQAGSFSMYIAHFREVLGHLFLLSIPGFLLAILARKRNLAYIAAFLFPFSVICLRGYSYQARYVYVLIPLLLVFSALTLDYIYEKVSGISSQISLTSSLGILIPALVVIFVAVHSFAPFTFMPQTRYDPGPTAPQGEFRPAHEYIRKNWSEDDVLITSLPPVTKFYMPENEYWPVYYLRGTIAYPQTRELKSVEQIKKLENEASGWVMVDDMTTLRIYKLLEMSCYTPKEVLKYIFENFEHVEEAKKKGLRIYRWS